MKPTDILSGNHLPDKGLKQHFCSKCTWQRAFFFLSVFFSLSFEVLLSYLIYNRSRTAKIIRFFPKLQCRERCYNLSCHKAIGGANPTQSLNPNPSCGAARAVSTQPALCCEVMASCWLWHSSLCPVHLRGDAGHDARLWAGQMPSGSTGTTQAVPEICRDFRRQKAVLAVWK